MVECNRQTLKQILTVNFAEDTPFWDRYIIVSIRAHNTTYHQSLKFIPTAIFHERIPYNALDLKSTNTLQVICNKVDLRTVFDGINQKYKDTTAYILEAFHNYIKYYDRKNSSNRAIRGIRVLLEH